MYLPSRNFKIFFFFIRIPRIISHNLFQLATSGMKKLLIIIYMGTFSMITPIGIAIGIAVTEGSNIEGSPSVAILQALAAGTLIYVVFFEVLEKERPKRHHSTEGGLETKSKKLHQLYGVIQVSDLFFSKQ